MWQYVKQFIINSLVNFTVEFKSAQRRLSATFHMLHWIKITRLWQTAVSSIFFLVFIYFQRSQKTSLHDFDLCSFNPHPVLPRCAWRWVRKNFLGIRLETKEIEKVWDLHAIKTLLYIWCIKESSIIIIVFLTFGHLICIPPGTTQLHLRDGTTIKFSCCEYKIYKQEVIKVNDCIMCVRNHLKHRSTFTIIRYHLVRF